MILRKGAFGAQVRETQQALVDLGYPLPRFGVDGDLGEETLVAMTAFLHDHIVRDDEARDVITDKELETLRSVRDRVATLGSPEWLVDRRAHASRAQDKGPRGGAWAWGQVRGIMLHQTAAAMGERLERYDGIGAHFVVLRSGKALWMHGLERIVWHGNGGNAQCVGIEFDGFYEGVQGNAATLWQPSGESHRVPMRPTLEQLETGRRLVRHVVELVVAHGGRVYSIFAHRQASGSRQSDPGSEIWQAVGIPTRDALKLSDGGPRFTFPSGGGLPIPEAWDASRVGVRY